jgi:thiosulfate dehydrogenase
MMRFAIMALVMLASVGCREEKVATPQAQKAASVAKDTVATIAVTDTAVFPSGPEGMVARRGLAILAATRDSLPGHIGNDLRCFSCHLDNGRRPDGTPLTGVYARYPKYTTRDGRVISIEDRVNNCIRRSMAGSNIPVDGDEMNAIVTYLAVISRGVPIGASLQGQGIPTMPDMSGDRSRGVTIFTARCARCHGDQGQGIPPATPLWGPRSYSVGASLARVERAAAFIRHNMPFDSAGVLSDQQAYDVAAYIVSQPRRDAHGKESDWPDGGAPRDVPYNTHGHAAFNPPPLLPAAFK